ncbi:hypothetical protein ENUP19_0353G0019 [Entamoeba nuttalli]|uniref:Uncharacterized protein n=1 Tax=Entamoeba nuttalli TaxID=412467 RepID=A0ABQ0DXY7_9EUKA
MTESSEEMGIIHNEIKEIISFILMEMNEKKSGMVLKNIKEIPDGMQNIPVIEGEDLYKYLGIWQSDEIDDTFNCKSIKEKILFLTRFILRFIFMTKERIKQKRMLFLFFLVKYHENCKSVKVSMTLDFEVE